MAQDSVVLLSWLLPIPTIILILVQSFPLTPFHFLLILLHSLL